LYSNLIGKYLVNRGIVKYLSYVGLISYSLYLIHQPYLNDLLNFYNPKTNNILINNFIRVAFTYITLFAISYSLYIFIEQRSIAYGKEIRKN
jgi:peptidoglycan/LPS O-acetylase OafA/YrhL